MPSISGTGYFGMNYDPSQGVTPPDTVVAAGPSYVVEAVNQNLFFGSKANLPNSLSGSVQSFASFFPGFTHGFADVITDPSVNYDAATGKWIISILDVDPQNHKGYLDIAVSSTNDPTGAWTKVQLDLTDGHGPLIPGNSGLTLWGDFERFGSSANAYVWTVNMFSFSSGGIDQNSLFDHVQVIAIDKSNLAGVHITDLPSWDSVTSTITNENLLPVRMDAPTPADGMWFAEEANYGTSSGQANALRLVHVANLLTATPADFVDYTGNVPLYQFTFVKDPAQGGNHPWNNGDTNAFASQKGSPDLIQTNDTRIDSAVWRTVNGQQHLVLTQTVGSTADPGVAKARWYDFNTTGATDPSVAVPLYKSAEINPGSGVFTYFPSAAIDAAGDVAMTYLESSANEYLSMYVTGKRLADSGMQPAALVVAGNTADTSPDGSPHRAGDYSGTVVNINNAGAATNSFWSANEYANGGVWGTAVENFSVGDPPPSTDMSVTLSGPSSVTAGTNATYTITVTNNGPGAAQGVVLNDTLPAGSIFVSMKQISGTDAFTLGQSGGSASETATGNFASGSSDSFTMVVFAPASLSTGASFSDTASVNASNPDANPANNSATVSASVTASTQLQDGGFEMPSVGSGAAAYLYDPTASPWTFVGQGGVSGNGSGFTSSNPSAPQGSQVAFLQNTGSFSQAVTLTAGSYAISFSAAQRATYQSSSQTFQVRIDGATVGSFAPSSSSYATFTTNVFTVAAGVHTITFAGLDPNGGDNTAFVDQVTLNAAPPPSTQLQDGGFEMPSVGSGAAAYLYDPTASPWTFVGQAGVSGNGSGFTSSNPSAPQGSQVAFLQNTGSFSQAVTLTAGSYAMSFSAAQRATYQSSSQTFQVRIDGAAVGSFAPSSSSYATFTTSVFTVAAGVHTITFAGLDPNGGDNTAFVDQVTLNTATPPPPPPTQLQDGGFETPSVGSGASAYLYDPTASPWTFVGQAGVSGNGSGFTSSNPSAPQGSQVAFLQNTGSFSQAVTLTAGSYAISFSAAQRATYQSSSQTFELLVDRVVVEYLTPASTSYATFTTNVFTVAAGVHTITFVGLNPNGGQNTAFVDQVTLNAAPPPPTQLQDGGFEMPSVGSGAAAYLYDPTASPWTFVGQAGVSGNGSGFTSSNPSAPQGSQVAFLQNTGSFSQAVTLTAGSYAMSFSAAQRATYQSSSQTFQVRIDGATVGSFAPSSSSYATFTTSVFTVAAGVHTIAFVGLDPNGGDNTAFVDQVTLNTATPPAGNLASFHNASMGGPHSVSQWLDLGDMLLGRDRVDAWEGRPRRHAP